MANPITRNDKYNQGGPRRPLAIAGNGEPTAAVSPFSTGENASGLLSPEWTLEQDTLLESLAGRLRQNWTLIAQYFPNKSNEDVEYRWSLLAGDQKTEWSDEGDNVLAQLFVKHGGNWKVIASQFDDKPAKEVKERFYSVVQHNFALHMMSMTGMNQHDEKEAEQPSSPSRGLLRAQVERKVVTAEQLLLEVRQRTRESLLTN